MNKEELYYQIATLEQENKQLKEIINKAIEYITKHYLIDKNNILIDGYLDTYEAVKLLEILKGE